MTGRDRETHENEERTVLCPVESCDATPLARALHLHVMQSADERHGDQGDIPDEVNLDAAKDAGTQRVEMEYPTEREQDDEPRLCPYCGETFAGGKALMIHLGQVTGRDDHPEDVAEKHDPEDFPRADDAGGSPPHLFEREPAGAKAGPYIRAERVYAYIGMLMAEGKTTTAQRARRCLLTGSVSLTTRQALEEAREAAREAYTTASTTEVE